MRRSAIALSTLVLALAIAFSLNRATLVAQQPGRLFVPRDGVNATERRDEIVLSGDSGWLQTPTILADFVLECEFRLVDVRSKARIGFRAWPGFGTRGRDYDGVHVHLTGDASGDRAMGKVSSSRTTFVDVPREPASAMAAVAVGQWYRLRLRVQRASASVTIDDRVVSEVTGLSEFAGYITLDGQAGTVEFRAVRLDRLTPSARDIDDLTARPALSGLQLPKALSTAKPRYPTDAYTRGIQGTVSLRVAVLADGSVGDMRVVRSVDPELDDAAMASVRQWRLTPATHGGTPVASLVSVDVSFNRSNGPQ